MGVGGFGEVQAAFLNESRTRRLVQRSVQEIRVREYTPPQPRGTADLIPVPHTDSSMLPQHGDRCRTQGELGENLCVIDKVPQA